MTTLDDKTKELLRDPRKRASWVKYQLSLDGNSLTKISKKHGLDRTCVGASLRKPYPHMEQLIAKALGLTPQVLFPERYDANGLPNRPMGRPKKSIYTKINKKADQRNVKKQKATRYG